MNSSDLLREVKKLLEVAREYSFERAREEKTNEEEEESDIDFEGFLTKVEKKDREEMRFIHEGLQLSPKESLQWYRIIKNYTSLSLEYIIDLQELKEEYSISFKDLEICLRKLPEGENERAFTLDLLEPVIRKYKGVVKGFSVLVPKPKSIKKDMVKDKEQYSEEDVITEKIPRPRVRYSNEYELRIALEHLEFFLYWLDTYIEHKDYYNYTIEKDSVSIRYVPTKDNLLIVEEFLPTIVEEIIKGNIDYGNMEKAFHLIDPDWSEKLNEEEKERKVK